MFVYVVRMQTRKWKGREINYRVFTALKHKTRKISSLSVSTKPLCVPILNSVS